MTVVSVKCNYVLIAFSEERLFTYFLTLSLFNFICFQSYCFTKETGPATTTLHLKFAFRIWILNIAIASY